MTDIYNIIEDKLNSFDTVKLKDIEGLVVERTETKYVCRVYEVVSLIDSLAGWKVLKHKGECFRKYTNIYFDTEDMSMLAAHEEHNGMRQKIRIRDYGKDMFVEIKTKCNGVSNKTRIKTNKASLEDFDEWIDNNLIYDNKVLQRTLETSYTRLTFVNMHDNERITIDFNVSFRNLITGKTKNTDSIIVEYKRSDRLHCLQLEECKFSKYYNGFLMTK